MLTLDNLILFSKFIFLINKFDGNKLELLINSLHDFVWQLLYLFKTLSKESKFNNLTFLLLCEITNKHALILLPINEPFGSSIIPSR